MISYSIISCIVPLKLLAKKILGLSRWHFTKSTSEIMQILDRWIALRYLCGISNTNPLPSLVIPVPPRTTSHDASAAAQHRQLAEGVNSTNEPPPPTRSDSFPYLSPPPLSSPTEQRECPRPTVFPAHHPIRHHQPPPPNHKIQFAPVANAGLPHSSIPAAWTPHPAPRCLPVSTAHR